MYDNELISVILCIYKESMEWIDLAVQSILKQTYKNIELVVIIDNPDVDNRILNYLESLQKKYRIIVKKNIENIGPGKSRDIGIRASSGNIIALMDADDISDSLRFEKEIELLMTSDCDVVSSSVTYIDKYGNKGESYKSVVKDIEKKLPFGNVIFNPTVMMKKKAYEAVGGYRDLRNGEDYDLWLRMLLNSKKFAIIHEPLLQYRIRLNSLSRSNIYKSYLITKYLQKSFFQARKKKKTTYKIDGINAYIKTEYSKEKENRYFDSMIMIENARTELIKNKIKGGIDFFVVFFKHPVMVGEKILTAIRKRYN